MPKGVEHAMAKAMAMAMAMVIHSLMPKGVEHKCWLIAVVAVLLSDPFVDAERR